MTKGAAESKGWAWSVPAMLFWKFFVFSLDMMVYTWEIATRDTARKSKQAGQVAIGKRSR